MDDLELEKLNKELHDVFGSDLYDADQTMEETGTDALAQAARQTEALAEEQDEMREELAEQAPDSAEARTADPADDIFASMLQKLNAQETAEAEAETEPLDIAPQTAPEAPAAEDDLPGEDTDAAEDADYETLIEQAAARAANEAPRHIDPDAYDALIEQAASRTEESDDEPEVPDETVAFDVLAEEATQKISLTQSAELVSQIVQALETESAAPVRDAADLEAEESVPDAPQDTEAAEKTPKKGFFARLFAPIDEIVEDEDESLYEDELDEYDEEAETEPPEENPDEDESVTEPDMPETEDAAEPEEEPDAEPDEEPEEEPEDTEQLPKKGFFSRLFAPIEDVLRDDEELEEIDTDEAEEAAYDAETVTEDAEPAAQPTDTADADEPDDTAPLEPAEPASEDETAEPDEPDEADEAPAKEAPQPRPEDTPVISEEELAEFLSDVDADEPEPITSFEDILEDNGVRVEEKEELKPKPPLPEEFPKKATTVYVDVPIREKTAEETPRRAEVFDAAAELEKEPPVRPAPQAAEEEADTPEEEPMPEIPEEDPAWMTQSLEELTAIAPPLTQLRVDGPVMAREVLRQKEWIAERVRQYQEENKAEEASAETPAAEDEPEESSPVFPERPIGTPETEATGREKEPDIHLTAAHPAETKPEEAPAPQAEQPPAQTPAEDEKDADEPEGVNETKDTGDAAQAVTPPREAEQTAKRAPEPPLISIAQADQACRKRTKSQGPRSVALAVLTVICLYISCAADFTILPLPHVISYASSAANVLYIFLLLLALSILLAYDVIWDGIRSVCKGNPNFSTLVTAAVLLNILHCAACLISTGEEIPFASLAMLTLLFQLRAQIAEGARQHAVYKVAGAAKTPVGIFLHTGKVPHAVKGPMPEVNRFAAQAAQRSQRKRLEKILTLSALLLACVLSAMVCMATGDFGRLIYVLAATVTAACQIALLSASAKACSGAARRMARSGAAVDADIGAAKLAKASAVVLTDEDLFPKGSVALERLELRSSLNDATALAYAAALTDGSSLGNMLAEEVRTRYGMLLTAHHVVHAAGGGISGQVGKLEVLLGDEDFMAERGIFTGKLPENALALALDGDIAAVLTIDYRVPAGLFRAMQKLTEQKTEIWLHSRNHQVTPELTERLYGLKPGTIVVPEPELDRALQNPQYTAHAQLCGMLLHDGLTGLADCICASRAQTRAERAGMLIGICAAALCMLLMAYLCYVFVPADAHPIRLLIYMVLCFVPIFFLENGVGKE